ncbi:glycosyltransferase family 4 protein [Pleionea sp. CnH1-48]|uniref:glycosyltransferase family 4 protein n=1 Tax=Pleionea sp. CnH1-48 TaxID=2954494 RepID=UPI0020980991|nr:glycosyltransferase family 4 protein [Pleionea sp. CnH1-48]MCO7226243.1 glycosyltransferase family 4 protein [Pleionea sp. CnH1-48]
MSQTQTMEGRPSILHVFSTFNIGGPQVRFAQLANAWEDQFHHHIIAMDGATNCTSLLNDKLSFEVENNPAPTGGLVHRLKTLRQFLQQHKPALLVTYNWGAIEWALARWGLSIPHIHIEDGFGPEEQNQQIPRRVWFRKIALKGADSVIVPSQTLAKIATDYWQVPSRKLHFIPNGVDLKHLDNPERQRYRSLFSRSSALRIGTLARIRKEKNIPRLIDAFEWLSKHHDIELYIAGDGPELDSVSDYVQQSSAQSRIHLVGNIKNPADFICHLDVFALSSDTEQMPYSVLEAAGASLPVAAVDVGDVKNLVAEENRQFVNGNDSEALKISLEEILSDADLRQRLGAANRTFCQQHFDQNVMIERYLNMTLELIG